MILHLENGGCEIDVDRDDITQLALECHSAPNYQCFTGYYDFQCPTCATPFEAVSGLFQHVESDACEENLAARAPLSRFVRFLKSRL